MHHSNLHPGHSVGNGILVCTCTVSGTKVSLLEDVWLYGTSTAPVGSCNYLCLNFYGGERGGKSMHIQATRGPFF